MNEHAYDVSYLESELVKADVPQLRVAKAPPAPPPASLQPAVDAAQEALARELLQAAAAHEELIQQYLRFSSSSQQGSFRH